MWIRMWGGELYKGKKRFYKLDEKLWNNIL